MIEKLQLARAKKEQRIDAGSDPVTAGWQCFLEEMLLQLENYMVAGRMVTFQQLTEAEIQQYQFLQQLRLPEIVCAVFIPPSVLHSMLSGGALQASGMPSAFPDAGVVLASRCRRYDLIVNTLFARPPYTPGIDVYEYGNLLAGYSYQTHAECQAELPKIIQTFLGSGAGNPQAS